MRLMQKKYLYINTSTPESILSQTIEIVSCFAKYRVSYVCIAKKATTQVAKKNILKTLKNEGYER